MLATFYDAVKGYPIAAVDEARERFGSGKIARSNHTYPPSSAEFAIECARVAEVQAIRSQPRVEYKSTYKSFDVTARRDGLIAKNAHREIIKENVAHEEWLRLSRERAVPVGASWIAALGTIYGPEPKRTSIA